MNMCLVNKMSIYGFCQFSEQQHKKPSGTCFQVCNEAQPRCRFFKNPFKINFVYHKIPHGRFGARKALFKKKEEGKCFQLSSTHSHAAAASFSVRLITQFSEGTNVLTSTCWRPKGVESLHLQKTSTSANCSYALLRSRQTGLVLGP